MIGSSLLISLLLSIVYSISIDTMWGTEKSANDDLIDYCHQHVERIYIHGVTGFDVEGPSCSRLSIPNHQLSFDMPGYRPGSAKVYPKLAESIKECQKRGVKVLLMVDASLQNFQQPPSRIASELHNTFLNGPAGDRPFGTSVQLDGVALKIRQKSDLSFWNEVAKRLRELEGSNDSSFGAIIPVKDNEPGALDGFSEVIGLHDIDMSLFWNRFPSFLHWVGQRFTRTSVLFGRNTTDTAILYSTFRNIQCNMIIDSDLERQTVPICQHKLSEAFCKAKELDLSDVQLLCQKFDKPKQSSPRQNNNGTTESYYFILFVAVLIIILGMTSFLLLRKWLPGARSLIR